MEVGSQIQALSAFTHMKKTMVSIVKGTSWIKELFWTWRRELLVVQVVMKPVAFHTASFSFVLKKH
jgi:hypothetical protein